MLFQSVAFGASVLKLVSNQRYDVMYDTLDKVVLIDDNNEDIGIVFYLDKLNNLEKLVLTEVMKQAEKGVELKMLDNLKDKYSIVTK